MGLPNKAGPQWPTTKGELDVEIQGLTLDAGPHGELRAAGGGVWQRR